MTANRELYHDGALCMECEEAIAVPDIPDGAPPDKVPVGSNMACRLICPACGNSWEETDYNEIARAWFAHGAYEQSLRQSCELDALRAEVAQYRESGVTIDPGGTRRNRADYADDGVWSRKGGNRAMSDEAKTTTTKPGLPTLEQVREQRRCGNEQCFVHDGEECARGKRRREDCAFSRGQETAPAATDEPQRRTCGACTWCRDIGSLRAMAICRHTKVRHEEREVIPMDAPPKWCPGFEQRDRPPTSHNRRCVN